MDAPKVWFTLLLAFLGVIATSAEIARAYKLAFVRKYHVERMGVTERTGTFPITQNGTHAR